MEGNCVFISFLFCVQLCFLKWILLCLALQSYHWNNIILSTVKHNDNLQLMEQMSFAVSTPYQSVTYTMSNEVAWIYSTSKYTILLIRTSFSSILSYSFIPYSQVYYPTLSYLFLKYTLLLLHTSFSSIIFYSFIPHS